jgi:hypothetical protein
MAVLANVSSPSSCSGCLHAVSLSCYNNVLWMGVSNCSLWRIELPLVDDVDISRDSLAEMSIKPKVTCELWSGMSHTPRSNTLLAHWSVFLFCGCLTASLACPGGHTMTTLSSSSPSAAASAAAAVVTVCSSGCIYLWNTGTTLPPPLLVFNHRSRFPPQRVMSPSWLPPAI